MDTIVEQDLSEGVKVQVGSVFTNTENRYHHDFIKLYPNPTNGLVILEMPSMCERSELRIYSIIGTLTKSVSLFNKSSQQINLGVIQEGVYTYEIWQEEKRIKTGLLQVR